MSSSDAAGHPLAAMFDVSCAVDVVIGATAITVRDCLAMGSDTVIVLRRPAGADLDIVVHGVTVAAGEVVDGNEGTALRIVRVAPSQALEPQP